jgi:DNA replication and repair protein RecF
MFLTHLSLTHFRNYQRLELDFEQTLTLLQGENAQGKTNLLEAIYFLATSKPVHAQSEREVVDWQAGSEPIPYCRVAGRIKADGREQEVEILLTPRGDGLNFKKQVKINGVPRRNVDLVGLLRAVLFLPEDIKLVDGAPGERRRYLDVALCQIDRSYMRSLAQCQKVVEQRNSLLKTLRERGVRPNAPEVDAQLGFWDDQLVQHGSAVIAARYRFLCELEPSAQARHAELSDGRERLTLVYLPSFNPGHLSDIDFAHLENDQFAEEIAGQTRQPLSAATAAVRFRDKLRSRRAREIDAGATLYGPQRDDLRFLANGRDLRLYGSRGQQRSAALSLKLAEVQAMTQRTGAPPLLLLDDVMSELDAGRRRMLLTALEGVEQAILTTTDWEDYTPEFRARARCIYVAGGGLRPMENNPF